MRKNFYYVVQLLTFVLAMQGCLLFASDFKVQLQALTLEEGLSRGRIQHLHLDHEGFLWVATRHGLNRFDAARNWIVSHQHPQLEGVSFDYLLEYDKDQLFAFSKQLGIFAINKSSGQTKLILDLTKQTNIQLPSLNHGIIESADVLLLAIDHTLYRFSLKTSDLEPLFSLKEAGIELGWISQLWLYQQQVFIGSNRGLFQYDLQKKSFQQIELPSVDPSYQNPMIRHLYATQTDLWISSQTALHKLPWTQLHAEVKDWKPELMLNNIRIIKMLQHHNTLMLGTTDGLYSFDETSKDTAFLWRFSQSNQEIHQDLIADVVASKDGGLWLSSPEHGVFYWHPRSKAFLNIPLPFSTETQQNLKMNHSLGALTFAQTTPQQLWVGFGIGLQSLDLHSKNYQNHRFPVDLPADFGSSLSRIYPEHADRLWLRSGNSLRFYSTQTAEFLPAPLQDPAAQNLLTEGTRGHWRDAKGRFWFFNLNMFYRYDPAKGVIEPLPGLLEHIPLHLAGRFLGELSEDPEQMLLSAHDQIWLYNANSQQSRLIYQTKEYEPGLERTADSMHRDPRGMYWITMRGVGLLGFDSDLQLKHHFHEQHRLLSNEIYASQLDHFGNLWFAGNYGLSKLNPEQLSIEHFTRKEGLASHAFNEASLRLNDGRLVFGHRQGLTLVDPAQLKETPQPPSVVITAIRALNQALSPVFTPLNGQRFEFSHDVPGLEIQFSSLNYRDNNQIYYRFWLEGEQKLNYPQQQSTQIVFPQLQPGQYQIFVSAISPLTGLESEPASIELQINPAPWKSQTAYSLYSAMVLLTSLLWLRNRQRQRRLLANAHYKVRVSEQRLKQALDAVESGAWEWHAHKNTIHALRVHSMLGYSEALNPLSMQQHLSLIHPDDREAYQHAWQRFTSTSDRTFDHTYRLQHKHGHWLWFRDIGKVTDVSALNKIERVIGTYSNITETRATKEKARLFGEAFQQTRDWVVLLDLEQRVIAANQSFSDVFGDMDEYLHNPRTHDLGISLNRRRFYTKLLAGMAVNQHWQGEETVMCPNGTERPTLINITAVGDDLQVEFFVLVFTDITAQKQAEDELRYLASYDALTGLPNRALLMDRIIHGIEQAKRERRSLALCFIDLDKFKQINDSLGHDIGDLLLKKVAKRLTDTLRQTDTVARLGGDEFVVLLEAYKNDDNISHVARKMIASIGEPMLLGTHTVSVSPSIGIAVYPEDASDAKELLKHADVAMYHAKDSGRNNFQFFIQEMNEKAIMQLARETQLRSAYQQNQFINYYQPIYDSRLQQMIGAEVLLRWQTDSLMVPPAEFIPLAEDLRLIVPMTLGLLERALADLQRWHQAGFPIYLSVNLSMRHLEQADLASQTRLLLAKYSIPASCLRFEVTESALMQDHESAIAAMLALSALGIQLALDDFGTGYSSLKYLKELPIDAIKIDRSFVKDIGIDINDETIIDAMLSMANSLGMYCIAEGVETEQQLAFFTKRQCFYIQGYLFGKPVPAEDLLSKLKMEQHPNSVFAMIPNPTTSN